MDKREFIKVGFAGTLGLMTIPAWGKKNRLQGGNKKEFLLPDLPYAYDAMEPHIDRETMEIHHKKHHAGYTAKLNAALSNQDVSANSARELLKNASKYSADIINNAGGYVNHKIYWKSMSPKGGGEPGDKIGELITRDFGSFGGFKEQFGNAAKTLFGSGWAWLVITEGKLKVVTTKNQDNPIMDSLPAEKQVHPVLCIDVWEHAYYLKYQNRRSEYVDTFWNLVNWKSVNKKLKNSKQV